MNGSVRRDGEGIGRRSVAFAALVLGSVFCLTCRAPNYAPTVPAAPYGPSSGITDSLYSFTSSATDPEVDSVCYRFDWGDGDTSEWTYQVPSGQSAWASHAWRTSGSFAVRAQAMDTGEAVSAWSNPHQMNVAYSWKKTFGGTDFDHGSSVQPTSEGGYIFTGGTLSFGAGEGDVWLVKTDAAGNKVWDRTFGGTRSDDGHTVRQTADGGYIIAATTESFGAGLSDAWLIKTDAAGNKVWDKTFGGAAWDVAASVLETADGYVFAGYTTSYGAGSSDVWLVKVDASGNKVWERTIGGIAADQAKAIGQTSDGGFIVTGITYSYGAGFFDIYLVRTDASGNKVWDRAFGGADADDGRAVEQTSDGGYIIAGYTRHADTDDAWLIKTDADGYMVWDKLFGGEFGDYGSSVLQTSDGGYLVTGWTSTTYGTGLSDVWLIKTDESGIKTWDRTFGGEWSDEGFSAQPTPDGGYIIVGATESYGAGAGDAWLIKTGANGR